MVHDMDAVLQHAQTVVIGNKDPEFEAVPKRLREDQRLVDLVRISDKGAGMASMTASVGEPSCNPGPRQSHAGGDP